MFLRKTGPFVAAVDDRGAALSERGYIGEAGQWCYNSPQNDPRAHADATLS